MPRRRKNKIKRRACALCFKMGHNFRTCPEKVVPSEPNYSFEEEFVAPSERVALDFEKENIPNKPKVVICGENKIFESPHLVDLRGNNKRNNSGSIETVEPYKSTPINSSEESKKQVDFAQMVREANKKEAEKLVLKQESKIFVHDRTKFPVEDFEEENKVSFFSGLFKVFWDKIHKPKIYLPRQVTHFDDKEEKTPGYLALHWRKILYPTVAIFVLVTIPFPAFAYYKKIKDNSEELVAEGRGALSTLRSSTLAALDSDMSTAQIDINKALESFSKTEEILNSDHKIAVTILKVIPFLGQAIESREKLMSAGQHLALANAYLLKGINEVNNAPSETALTDRLELLNQHLKSALPQYKTAFDDISLVNEKVLPKDLRGEFSEFKVLFGAFTQDLNDLAELAETLNTILGNDSFRRYLLVFQNSNELRPTGGFVGSLAVLDLQKGKIEKIDTPAGGSYDLKGQLDVAVIPPLPVQLVNSKWEFQDGNWFPDFAASADKLAWFYAHSRNTTLDGVIAINSTVLERLLKVMGSLTSEKHNLVINENDAIDKLQYKVEVDYVDNKPKEIIGDLMNDLISKMAVLDSKTVIKLLLEMNSALKKKEIQAFFYDPKLQKTIREFNWSGEIKMLNPGQDYLNVVSANLQGQKSDKEIKQTISHEVFVQEDGMLVDKVIIKRKHEGTSGEMFTGAPNVSYLRVYVPFGATLLEAGGFDYPGEENFHVPENWYEKDTHLEQYEREIGIDRRTGTRITNEFGKTAFGNWVITNPGEESEVYFIYKLPFALQTVVASNKDSVLGMVFASNKDQRFKYSLVIQKQSGIDSEFVSNINLPESNHIIWSSVDGKIDFSADNTFNFNNKFLLEKDSALGLVIEKKNSKN